MRHGLQRQRCVAWLGIILGLCVAAGAARAQTAVERFYSGRQVTLIIGADSGGGYDALARLMSRHLGAHIPGRPAIVPQNQPAAGSLVAANNLFNTAARDGSVIGTVQRGMLIAHLANPETVRFEIAKFNWLGSLATETGVTVVWHSSPVRTIEDLRSREVVVGGTPGSDPELAPRTYNALLGTRFKIVNGYTGTAEIALAMERGEVEGIGDWSWSSLKVQRPDWLRDNKVRLVMQGGLHKHAELPDLPNALDNVPNERDRRVLELYLAQKEAARPVLAPPGVPADRLAALRQAFADMAKDKAFLEDAVKSRLMVDPTSAESITRVVEIIATAPKELTDRLMQAVVTPK